MRIRAAFSAPIFAPAALETPLRPAAQVFNLNVVTEANPDDTDLDSLMRSATFRWTTPAEKCSALFYWGRIARPQTASMTVHGRELTDSIRRFDDSGHMMRNTTA